MFALLPRVLSFRGSFFVRSYIARALGQTDFSQPRAGGILGFFWKSFVCWDVNCVRACKSVADDLILQ